METQRKINAEEILNSLLNEGENIKDKVSIYFEELNDQTLERNIKNASLWNENAVYYPASILKLFVAVMAEDQLLNSESNLVQNTKTNDEAIRAIEETITVSDNDALAYLTDLVTGTSSGPELEGKDFEEFKTKRNLITDFFHDKAYSEQLQLANKCFSFDKYGRDKELVEAQGENVCTIIDVAHVMKEIRAKNPQVYKFLLRDLTKSEDYQTKFIGAGLKNYLVNEKKYTEGDLRDFSFYSKAGWMSKNRHDAAIIDEKYLLVIMTKGLSDNAGLIPKIAKKVCEQIDL